MNECFPEVSRQMLFYRFQTLILVPPHLNLISSTEGLVEFSLSWFFDWGGGMHKVHKWAGDQKQ